MRTTQSFRLAALVLSALAVLALPAGAAVENAPNGIRFTYTDPLAGSVYVAGDFNQWNASAQPLAKDGDVWSVVLKLEPGEHQYKFVIDGQWVADPGNPVTGGDYGNSVVKVDESGKIVAMKPTSNTELSPKIYFQGRTIAELIERRSSQGNPEWNLDRPRFVFDLDFGVRMNEILNGRILTQINNQNQNVQLWETNLAFNRGNLTLESPELFLMMSDNDSVTTWDDPMHLVGNIGIYGLPWGFDQQGAYLARNFGKFRGRLLYADNFRTGGTVSPSANDAIALLSRNIAADTTADRGAYLANDSDNNKDVLALRFSGPLGDALTVGASFRMDRGRNPGAFVTVREEDLSDPTTLRFELASYGGSVENWRGGGVDLHYFSDPAGLEFWLEGLYGEAWMSGGFGEVLQVTAGGIDTVTGSVDPSQIQTTNLGQAPGFDSVINQSVRVDLGLHYFAYRGWHWRAGFNYGDMDIQPPGTPSGNRSHSASTYTLGLEFNGEEWKRWPWKVELGFDYTDFDYADNAVWTDQFWFNNENFWLEQGYYRAGQDISNLVTIDRVVMLGGDDVLSWKPRAEWTFSRGRNGVLRYRGTINSTGFDTTPKYWETALGAEFDLSRRVQLVGDFRNVNYNDPVLGLDEGFSSLFAEVNYRFTPDITVGLSWGVDPWVLDPFRNEYYYQGRDVFLYQQGLTVDAAKQRYLDMGGVIAGAERSLEDETRFMLQALVRF